MLFGIEADLGTRIMGYLVGDSFTGKGRLRIVAAGREPLLLETNERRDAIVAAGRHESGLCGFTIDETVIADLGALETLEILDADTGILLYRRRPPSAVFDKKLFRLETHLLPMWRVDDALERHFQYFYKGLERYGGETSLQIFHISGCTSLYASGRLELKSIEHLLVEGFERVTLLRDPYHELAERLLVLDRMGKVGADHLGMRDAMIFDPAIRFAGELDFRSPGELGRALRRMPAEVARILSNPLTRQLTSRTPGETVPPTAVPAALSTLAEFTVVGIRGREHEFRGSLAALLGIGIDEVPEIGEHPRIIELGEEIRRSRAVDGLLNVDVEVFSVVKDAFARADMASEQP